jgi:hypothetical protein
MVWHLVGLLEHCAQTKALISGKWVPARPLIQPFIVRLRAAWLVMTGRADAVIWPEKQ